MRVLDVNTRRVSGRSRTLPFFLTNCFFLCVCDFIYVGIFMSDVIFNYFTGSTSRQDPISLGSVCMSRGLRTVL